MVKKEYKFVRYEDGNTDNPRTINLNVDTSITAVYEEVTEVGEINKTTTVQVTGNKNLNLKWILSDAEPAAPDGFTRLADLDISLGSLGTLWAFSQ